jgi:hypothetical protein
MNAFKHGLAAIQKRRSEGVPTEHEENVRQQILDGLIASLALRFLRKPTQIRDEPIHTIDLSGPCPSIPN